MRIAALSLVVAAAATAQPSNWTLPVPGSYVALAAERPLFSNDAADFGALTSAWTFETKQVITPGVRLVGELPFAFASIDVGVGDESGAALGNAMLGAELVPPTGPLTFGGYLRVPTATSTETAGDVATAVGFVSDYERYGAFFNDILTVAVSAEATPALATAPVSFRLRAVPQVLIATDDGVLADDAEVLIGYAAQAIADVGPARVLAGLSGISIVTQDVDDRHNVSLGVSADVGIGSAARVGLTGRIPIAGEAEGFLDGVVGVRLVYGGI